LAAHQRFFPAFQGRKELHSSEKSQVFSEKIHVY